jgi:RNA polymerase sigma factor (sigma-70 family)
MDISLIEESDIVKLCIKGDRRSQMHLYDKYNRAMFNVAMRYMSNADDAMDMMQEGFIKAFSKIDKYNNKDSIFGAWLKRIVINTCLDELRKKKLDYSYEDEIYLEPIDEDYQHIDDEQLVKAVKMTIAQLPEKYSTIVSLYLIEGYDYEEVAEIMNINPGTARSIVSRGKSKLRELLSRDEFIYKEY